MTRTFPQQHCRNVIDHGAHTWWQSIGCSVRCPGRHTPRLHRAPDPQPRPGWTPDDPFAGLDETEE